MKGPSGLVALLRLTACASRPAVTPAPARQSGDGGQHWQALVPRLAG